MPKDPKKLEIPKIEISTKIEIFPKDGNFYKKSKFSPKMYEILTENFFYQKLDNFFYQKLDNFFYQKLDNFFYQKLKFLQKNKIFPERSQFLNNSPKIEIFDI